MQSIQDAIEAGTLDAEIAVVITDVPGAAFSPALRATIFPASGSTTPPSRQSSKEKPKRRSSASSVNTVSTPSSLPATCAL
jgi:hypothetical protein